MKKEYNSRDYREIEIYRDVDPADWNHWQWQPGHAIGEVLTLNKVMSVDDQMEAECGKCLPRFKMIITPYSVAMIDHDYHRHVNRLHPVPGMQELHVAEDDPRQEDGDNDYRLFDSVAQFLSGDKLRLDPKNLARRRSWKV